MSTNPHHSFATQPLDIPDGIVEETQPQEESIIPSTSTNYTFKDELWDGYSDIAHRLGRGRDTLSSMGAAFKGQREMHGKMAKTMAKMKIQTEGVGTGFVGPLSEMMKFCQESSTQHTDMRKEIDNQMSNLKTLKKDIDKNVKTYNANYRKLQKELASAQNASKNAKKNDENLGKLLMRLTEKRANVVDATLPPKKLDKMNKQLENSRSNAKRARVAYERSIFQLHDIDQKYYMELGDLQDKMQQFDMERMKKTKMYLQDYARMQAAYAKQLMESANTLLKAADTIDLATCQQNFILQTRTGEKPPAPDNFEPIFKDSSMLDDPLMDSKSIPQSGPTEMVMTNSTSNPPQQTNPPVQPSQSQPQQKVLEVMYALYDYEPENPDELRLKVGDRIEIMDKNEDGWFYGKGPNGKSGDCPSNFLSSIPPTTSIPEPQQSQPEPQSDVLEVMYALYDYEPDSQDELAMRAGDRIEILFKNEDGWYLGRNSNGLQGDVPSNYLSSSPPS